jgi:hypothetical protein
VSDMEGLSIHQSNELHPHSPFESAREHAFPDDEDLLISDQRGTKPPYVTPGLYTENIASFQAKNEDQKPTITHETHLLLESGETTE